MLDAPPDGLSVEKVSPTPEGITMFLHTDGAKVKPGLKGNLIVDVSVERSFTPASGKQQTRNVHVPLGTLPAIPFEVVDKL